MACARGVAISPLGKCWGNRCQPPFGPNCVCTQAIHHDPSTGSCSAGCAGHDGVICDGGYWGARCQNERPRGPLVQAGLDATAFFYFFFLFLFGGFFCFSFGDAQTTPNSSSIAAVSEDSGTHFPGRIGTIQGSNPTQKYRPYAIRTMPVGPDGLGMLILAPSARAARAVESGSCVGRPEPACRDSRRSVSGALGAGRLDNSRHCVPGLGDCPNRLYSLNYVEWCFLGRRRPTLHRARIDGDWGSE